MTDFEEMFKKLTGYEPLRWQSRLYDEWLDGDIQPVIDLPTGMGKTNIMAIWFIARAKQMEEKRSTRLPTRLVYVVDRRTVVDQATMLAETIKCEATKVGVAAPAVSTLRGQFADNRDWTRDPSQPAIVIGTVDMIGSRLLFSGYRSSYKQRPLDAGLLGQDSLLILDEAHLSEPFAKLVGSIGGEGRFQTGQGKPMRVVRMSATINAADSGVFRLSDADLVGDKQSNVVLTRYQAEKHLNIHEPVEKQREEIVRKAAQLAGDGSRIVVFVRSPDDALNIAEKIRESGDKKNKPFKNAVEILTGTMRGLERDELIEHSVMQRFLHPANQADDGPAILVSTSAGEVGFDLNADHLVCDAAPLDSIIQRLGRVNRRGERSANVHIFPAKPKDKRKKGTDESEEIGNLEYTYETASIKAVELLKRLPKFPDGSLDASPKALAGLDKPDKALTPKPAIVELTDILLDAWSMTTIVEPMPGRPPVADWLRGIADDMPDTTIAWRAELDIDGFGDLDIGDIEEWFDAHRVLSHETLTVPTKKAAEFLIERWKILENKPADQIQKQIGEHPCVIDQGGLRMIRLRDLIGRIEKNQMRDILNADVILPASFGGIERGVGLLDSEAPKSKSDAGAEALVQTATVADVADKQLSDTNRRCRLMKIGESEEALCDDKPVNTDVLSKFVLDLRSDDDTVRQLISMIPKRDRPEYGSQKQSLAGHVTCVEKHAEEIAKRLNLEAPSAQALRLAAKWHDSGKCREIWQVAVGGSVTEPLAKSGGQMRHIAGDYRHEFGSLREFIDNDAAKCNAEIFDLAAHLIAAHHGRGRPHFSKGGFDPGARAKSRDIAVEVMRRFARLQRKYGYWRLAWLENLLRCADALASAENDGGLRK